MAHSVYSFADVTLVLSHPAVGQFTFQGKGLGSITISRSNDMSQHDVGADGSVMISKIKTQNGTMALAIQQTSQANAFLAKWSAYLDTAPSSEFAKTTGTLKGPGENTVLRGVTPQKMADKNYQQAGQQNTWNLMVAEIVG